MLKDQAADPTKELIRYEYDDMIEKYTMFNATTNEVILKELREETVARFKEKPEQFVIKQNTKEEAGAPFHVRMLMDEFANINEIAGFSEVLATVRKYNMSVVIILQSLCRLKKRYEKDYESIIDNCDTFVFLGSKGQETTEYVSKMLGNMTITVRSANESMGKSRSSGYGYQQTKRELMTPHELVMLPTDEQVVIVKSVYPFKIPKFKLEDHPNFKQCADGDGARLIIQDWFNLQEKIARLEQKHGIETKREKQEDINKRAQQPVDDWINKQLSGERNVSGKNDKEDEFFF
jgi:type IV secretory pathway TraG/TraD family ATPase VirD4